MKFKGFTVLEILVAVTVVVILSGIIYLTWWGNMQKRSRDAQRIQDVNVIKLAVEAYFEKNNKYPPLAAAYSSQTIFTSDQPQPWIPELIPAYIKELPKDPKQALLPTFLVFKDLLGKIYKNLKPQEVLAANPPPTVVDSLGTVGRFNSIYCLSPSDCKIAYRDDTNANLKFVDCNNVTCSDKTITTVDVGNPPDGNTGWYISLFCLTTDDCKISYVEGSLPPGARLMMADCNDPTCTDKTITLVSEAGNIPEYTSIFCLSSTDCKIAFSYVYGGSEDDLMMVDCDDSACTAKTVTIVDAPGAVGDAIDIFCLATNDCKISYYDDTNKDVKMADCDDPTCATRTLTLVRDLNSKPAGTSIYCLATNDCKISYQAAINLEIADCDNSTCSTRTVTVVDAGAYGRFSSLYCLSSTDCKISYEDTLPTDLNLADCGGNPICTTKTITTVDSGLGTTGSWIGTGIFCTSSTNCQISYHNYNNGDLKFACTAGCSAYTPPSPTPTPSPAPAFLYLYNVTLDRKSYQVWAHLENDKDPRIYTHPETKCKATPLPEIQNQGYNFCGAY